jgi:RNA polymerase sigma-70 factor (ECF subfamily)
MGTHTVLDAAGPPFSGGGGQPPFGGSIETLIREARAGSAAAQGLLLEHCRRYLLLVANGSLDSDLRPKIGASDLVQDTFLEAHRDFSHFEGTTEPELLAWLTKILTNRVCNNVRHFRGTLKRNVHREESLDAARDVGELSLSTPGAAPIQALIARDDMNRLRTALARLPNSMREVLILRTWERQSFVKIAAQLQRTPDSVRKLWGRAVRRLQLELEDQP